MTKVMKMTRARWLWSPNTWKFLRSNKSEIELSERSHHMKRISSYVNCVGKMLDVFKVNHLNKFSVGFEYRERFTPNLNNWVQSAVEKNIKDISLSSYGPYGWSYKLPQVLYSHSSLTNLSISSFAISPKETVNLPSLKSLSLDDVKFSDCSLEKLLPGCPVLEDLSLISCGRGYTPLTNGFTSFNICSSSLKRLTLTDLYCLPDSEMEKIFLGCPALEALCLKRCEGFTCLNISSPTFTKLEIEVGRRSLANNSTVPTIDISAPYARELKITKWWGAYNIIQFRLRDVTSLVRASLDLKWPISSNVNYMTELLQSLQNVKDLELGRGWSMALSDMEWEELKIQTSTRRFLTLNLDEEVSVPAILCILKASPYLETLTLKGHLNFPYGKDNIHPGQGLHDIEYFDNIEVYDLLPERDIEYLDNIDLGFHHLKTIDITYFKGDEPMMILVQLLLKSANVLQKMTVSYNSMCESKKLYEAVLAIPRASREAIVEVNRVEHHLYA